MLTIQRLKGVNLNKAVSISQINTNELELAAAAVPGWKMLLNPSSAFFDETTGVIKNRVVSNSKAAPRTGTTALPTLGQFSGGQASFNTPASAGVRIYDVDVKVNFNSWSAFFVCFLPGGIGPDEVFGVKIAVADPDYALRFGFNSEGTLRVWRGSTSARLSHGTGEADYYNQLVYCMATFSTNDGLRLYRNGVEVATALSDKAPLTIGDFALFSSSNSGSGGFNGKLGHIGLLDIGLSDTANATYRQIIDEWIKDFYGIA